MTNPYRSILKGGFSMLLCLFSHVASGQSYYVLANPSLNIRNASNRDQILASAPFGAEVLVSKTVYESGQISGLDGNWIEISYTDEQGKQIDGVVFDAFIFPFPAPAFFSELGNRLTFEGYGWSLHPVQHHDIDFAAGFKSCNETDVWNEGVEFSHEEMVFSATRGQALRMFRMWVEFLSRGNLEMMGEDDKANVRRILQEAWTESAMHYTQWHEGGYSELTLQVQPNDLQGTKLYTISLEQHAH